MKDVPSRLLKNSLLAFFICSSVAVAAAQQPASSPAVVSIVIDDIGHSLQDGQRVIALPAPVALAVLPHTPHGTELAEAAHRAKKEVLLHLPMDPEEPSDAEAGPGRIEKDMSAAEIGAMLSYDLQTVPHAIGFNNHMGSGLTQNTGAMHALMRAVRRRGGLFFLDSLTTPRSVAARIAVENNVPTLIRDVFLDTERGEDGVRQSIDMAERLLSAHGRAVVIGHPYPETLNQLERWLPTLAARGIRVIPLSVMLTYHSRPNTHADRTTSPRPRL